MKRQMHTLGVWFAGLVCCTFLVPIELRAAEAVPGSTAAIPTVRDVALGKDGRMTGQLVDAQGQGRANQVVLIQRPGSEPQRFQTDRAGRFTITGLSGGTYHVATADAAAICRCWSVHTAPPAAQRELLLVSGDGIQRGQHPFGEMLFSAPVLIALVIAAAIAIPIAVHNSRDDAS